MKSKGEANHALAAAPITAFLSTTNPVKSRAFYEKVLGLRFESDEPVALLFRLAGGVPLRIQKVEKVTPQPFTAFGWQVEDIVTAVRSLKSRGVNFERYDFMKQDANGVWLAPSGTKVAWFKDPDGHLLSLSQAP